jgi:hypothetical protein
MAGIIQKGCVQHVFIDASSAILLYKSDLFDALLNAWQLVMAPAVFREITEPGYPGAAYFKTLGNIPSDNTGRIIFQEPGPADPALFAHKNFLAMDKGEQETLQLFYDSNGGNNTGNFILLDDGRAARFCHARQIPFINALLVPKLFWYAGRMDQHECLKKTARLSALGRYANRIIEIAGRLSRKELAYFIERRVP